MAAFARRVQRLLLCGSNTTGSPGKAATVHQATGPITVTGDREAQLSSAPASPEVIHRSRWNELSGGGRPYAGIQGGPSVGGIMALLLLGAPGVGKKSLKNKLFHDDMKGEPPFAISPGEDMIANFLCDGYEFSLDFTYQLHEYYALGSHYGIILTYDIVSRESWEQAMRLHNVIQRAFEDIEGTVPVLVLGLKADLGSWAERFPRSEAELFAHQHRYLYSECSSLTGEGVLDAFASLVKDRYNATIAYEGDLQRVQQMRDRNRRVFAKVVGDVATHPHLAGYIL